MRAEPPLDAAARALRETEELAADKARLAMWAEEEATRALNATVSRFRRLHGAAIARINDTLVAVRRQLAARAALSPANIAKLRSPAARRELKADLKKGIGFAKRAMCATAETLEGLLRDVASTSLTRYAGEIALSMGSSDMLRVEHFDALVSVCSSMHSRYSDFTPVLVQTILAGIAHAAELTHIGALDRAAQSGGTGGAGPSAPVNPMLAVLKSARARYPFEAESGGGEGSGVTASGITSAAIASMSGFDAKAAAQRMRVLLRFLLELVAVGIISDASDIFNILIVLLGEPAKEVDALSKAKQQSRPLIAAEPAGDALPPQTLAELFKDPRPPTVVEVPPPVEGKAVATAASDPPPSLLLRQLAAPPISDRVAKRSVRELPIVLALLRSTNYGCLQFAEDFLGVPSRSTRPWIASLPSVSATGNGASHAYDNPYLDAWLRARQGEEPQIPLFKPNLKDGEALDILLRPVSTTTSAPPVSVAASAVPAPTALTPLHLRSLLFSAEQQFVLLRSFDRFYDAVARALVIETASLRKAERRAELAQFSNSETRDKQAADVEALRASQERLLAGVTALADVLDRVLPTLPTSAEDEEGTSIGGILTIWAAGSGFGGNGFGPFEDSATFSFYREIRNLRESIPKTLLDPDLAAVSVSAAAGDAELISKTGGAVPGARIGNRFEKNERARGDLDSALKQLSIDAPVVSSSASNSATSGPASSAARPGGPAILQKTPAADVDDGPDDDTVEFKPSADLVSMLADDDGGSGGTDAAARTAAGLRLTALLNSLPQCCSREAIDEWAGEFVLGKFNTKAARARLLKRLFDAPTTYTDSYSFYARLVAVLDTGLNDFSKPLVRLLEEQLRFFLRSKPRSAWDAKSKVLRMLSELCKFKICQPGLMFRVSHKLIEEGTNGCLQLVTVLLEVCGRYLFLLSPETNSAMVKLLDSLKRVRDLKGHVRGSPLWDSIEASYFTVVPAEAPVRRIRVRDPIHAFLRYLLLDRLTISNLDETLKTVRRLPWNDSAARVREFLVKVSLSAATANFDTSRIELIVSLLAGIKFFYDTCIVSLVDTLQARIFAALSEGGRLAVNASPKSDVQESAAVPAAIPALRTKLAQRAFGLSRMLAECYNYKLCDSSVIFRALYTCINWQHEIPVDVRRAGIDGVNGLLAYALDAADTNSEAAALLQILPRFPLPMPPTDPGVGGWGFHPTVTSAVDPSTSMLRVRMVCAILDACGPFFRPGTALGARLDRFLVYFRRYFVHKTSVPIDTEITVAEGLAELRPSFALNVSVADAEAAAEAIERQEAFTAAEDAELLRATLAGAPRDLTAEQAADEVDDDEEDDDDGSTDSGFDGTEGEIDDIDEEDDGSGNESDDDDDDEGVAEEEENDGETDEENQSGTDDVSSSADDEAIFIKLTGPRGADSSPDALDDDFERAFSSIMTESLEVGRSHLASARSAADNMAIPVGFVSRGSDAPEEATSGVVLTLIKRRGARPPGVTSASGLGAGGGMGRVDARAIVVPASAELAQAAARAAEAQRAESEDLAHRTLALHEAAQAAEASGLSRRGGRRR